MALRWAASGRIAGPDHHRRLFRHEPEPLLGFAQLLLRGEAGCIGGELLEGEADLARDGDRDLPVALGEDVRLAVIGHELPDHRTGPQQRDEGEAEDAFGDDLLLDPVRLGGVADVAHEDRFRVDLARLPRRMAGKPRPVVLGDAAPRDELHHAMGIEEQDRRAVAEDAADRVEPGREDLGERPGTV
jgi:hypothetical protein